MSKHSFKLHKDQRGIVALVVTMLIMIILTITTLAMAKIARREQRQALDRLLSLNAYYAAESGINDAVQFVRANPSSAINDCAAASVSSINTTPTANDTQPTMANKLVLPGSASNVLGAYNLSTQYVCALITKDPTSLEYSQVTSDKSVVADFTSVSPTGVFPNHLQISWEDYQSGLLNFRNGANCGQFSPASTWSSAPLLRVDITNLTSGNYARASMAANTGSFYLDPCLGSAPYNATSTSFVSGIGTTNGPVISGNCDPSPSHTVQIVKPLRCNVDISFSAAGGTYSHLLVRIKPVYGDARVSIRALSCPAGGCTVAAGTDALPMNGAQTVIDVTGKAADQVKRTQVRLGDNTSPYLYAIESSGAVCKRLQLYSNFAGVDLAGVNLADQDTCDPRN